jgi:hypothetical protein
VQGFLGGPHRGIIIGTLGVLDDVTVTQVASVDELDGRSRATAGESSTARPCAEVHDHWVDRPDDDDRLLLDSPWIPRSASRRLSEQLAGEPDRTALEQKAEWWHGRPTGTPPPCTPGRGDR